MNLTSVAVFLIKIERKIKINKKGPYILYERYLNLYTMHFKNKI